MAARRKPLSAARKEKIARDYMVDNRSLASLARENRCTADKVKDAIKSQGVPLRTGPAQKNPDTKNKSDFASKFGFQPVKVLEVEPAGKVTASAKVKVAVEEAPKVEEPMKRVILDFGD